MNSILHVALEDQGHGRGQDRHDMVQYQPVATSSSFGNDLDSNNTWMPCALKYSSVGSLKRKR